VSLARLLIAFLLLSSPSLEASQASPVQTRQEASGLFQEARKYEQQGDQPKAEQLYLEYLRPAPRSAVGHTNLGVVYAHEANFDKAIAEYKQALLIDPSLQPVYTNLGIACFKSGRFAEAVKPLEKVHSLDPQNGDKATARQEFAIAESLSEAESGHDILRFAQESQRLPK
jgi:tetratricopeptide (TPR) repeat protein